LRTTDLRQDLKKQRVSASETGALPVIPHNPILTLDAKANVGDDLSAPQRIAKVMARAGACSRRDAEVWIFEGRVALNGAVLTDPAINVSAADEITIDGEPLARRAPTRLFLFHKPRGLVTTERDPEGRPTIFDHLRDAWPEGPRVVSVGRLDINTEGLLLLTNDGGLARLLELPSTGWLRRYRVRAKGETDQGVLDGLRGGLNIEGVDYAGIEATLDREQGANSWLTIALREGKNREIKRVLEHIGLQVNRLIRVSFGPFQLADIVEGAVEEVRTRVLRDQLGPLAAKAGADFTSPPHEEEDAQGSRIVLQARPAERPGSRAPRGPMLRNDSPQRETRGSSADRRREESGGFPAKGRLRPTPQPERGGGAAAKGRPAPGPRKHVSALRSGEGESQTAGRKRIERAETADRSGRTVQVERLVPTTPQGKGRERPATRNGRRFEAERKIQDGGDRAPARSRGPKPDFATKRGGGPKDAPSRRSENPAYASRAAASKSRYAPDQAHEPATRPKRLRDESVSNRAGGGAPRRGDDAPERRREPRRDHKRPEPPAAAEKSSRPKVSGKPYRDPAARSSDTRRGETDVAPRFEGAGRSRPGGPPKRPEKARAKFGAKDAGGAKRPGRTIGAGDSKPSGRSKGPGRSAKPGTGRPRDKR
jgi:23S rRNA pseudouridine2605 synthase